MQRAGGLFSHVDHQIDLVGRARHFLRFHVHFREETQAVHAVAGQADLVAVVPGGFVLTELTANDFVTRAVVATDVDTAHVGAACWFGLQHKIDAIVLAVDFGHSLYAGECKTKTGEILGEGLGGFGHLVGVVGLAGADGHQRLELVLTVQVVAFEFDTRHHIPLAFRHIDGDGDVLLVRRDGDLRRVHTELEVAALQIIGAQGFEVGIELGTRVAIRLGVPAQPAPRVLVEQALERGFAERLVAHDAHFLDACRLTFRDREGQVHPVALDGRDRGHHLGAIQALVDVLALELLFSAVGQRLVIRAAFRQAHFAHGFFEGVFVEFAGTGKVHVGDGGALFDHHHQHIAAGLQAHILEESQTEQRTDCGSAFFVVVVVTDPQGHGCKHGAGLHTLQAFHANVLHLEWLQSPCRIGDKNHGGNGRCSAHAQAIDVFFHE